MTDVPTSLADSDTCVRVGSVDDVVIYTEPDHDVSRLSPDVPSVSCPLLDRLKTRDLLPARGWNHLISYRPGVAGQP